LLVAFDFDQRVGYLIICAGNLLFDTRDFYFGSVNQLSDCSSSDFEINPSAKSFCILFVALLGFFDAVLVHPKQLLQTGFVIPGGFDVFVAKFREVGFGGRSLDNRRFLRRALFL
jgi:hypothetical protein